MRKLILAIALGLSVSACDPIALFQASTASIANPVTKDMLYEVENGTIVAFAALKAYKKSCVDLLIPQSCRQTIKSIQAYTRQIPPVLSSLRSFVKNNDQVNAIVAYNTIMSLVANFKAVAAANNVQVQ